MPMNKAGQGRFLLVRGCGPCPVLQAQKTTEVMPDVPEKRKAKLTLVKLSPFSVAVSLTPLQLLGVILKSVLQDRITDEEIDKICSVYYDTVKKWFG